MWKCFGKAPWLPLTLHCDQLKLAEFLNGVYKHGRIFLNNCLTLITNFFFLKKPTLCPVFVKFHFLFCLCLTVIQLLYVWVCFRSAFLSSAQQSNSTSCWIIKQRLEGMLSFCTASKFVGCVGQFLWLSKVGNPAFMATLCSIWSGLWRWRVCLNSVYAAININSCAKN